MYCIFFYFLTFFSGAKALVGHQSGQQSFFPRMASHYQLCFGFCGTGHSPPSWLVGNSLGCFVLHHLVCWPDLHDRHGAAICHHVPQNHSTWPGAGISTMQNCQALHHDMVLLGILTWISQVVGTLDPSWVHLNSADANVSIKGKMIFTFQSFSKDFLTLIPLDTIGLLSGADRLKDLRSIKVIRVLRLLKLMRLLRSSKLTHRDLLQHNFWTGQSCQLISWVMPQCPMYLCFVFSPLIFLCKLRSWDSCIYTLPTHRAATFLAGFDFGLPLVGLRLGYDTEAGGWKVPSVDQRDRGGRFTFWHSHSGVPSPPLSALRKEVIFFWVRGGQYHVKLNVACTVWSWHAHNKDPWCSCFTALLLVFVSYHWCTVAAEVSTLPPTIFVATPWLLLVMETLDLATF